MAQSARTLHDGPALSWGTRPRVVAVSQRMPGCFGHCALCAMSRASCVVSWHIVASYHSPGALYRDPKSPPSTTIQFLYRNPLLARPSTCAAACPCARPAVSWPPLAVLQHLAPRQPGRVEPLLHAQASLPSPVSRYNSLYHDTTHADG